MQLYTSHIICQYREQNLLFSFFCNTIKIFFFLFRLSLNIYMRFKITYGSAFLFFPQGLTRIKTQIATKATAKPIIPITIKIITNLLG